MIGNWFNSYIRGAGRLISMTALTFSMLVMGVGSVDAAPVSIGGQICAGAQEPTGNTDPLTGLPVMRPVMACTPVAGAQVMVQDPHGAILGYGVVTGNAWEATVDPAVNGTNQYIVMYAAPGYDATSRDFRVADGATSVRWDAYLPPLPHKKASLLIYAFKDEYMNTEDDFPDDPPLNGVTFLIYDESGNLVTSGVSGDPAQSRAPGAGADKSGLYYFKDALEPGDYEICVDMNTLPASPNGFGWYQTSTSEGGPCWEVTLYPGDPGTMAGGYMAWFSFVEKIGNSPLPATPEYGENTITGVIRDADGPFFAALGEPWAPLNPYVTPNCEIGRGLVVLWKDTPIKAVATAETDANGRFTFNNVAPGNYRVFIEDVGLSYIWQEFKVTVAPATNVDIGYAYMPRWYARINGYVVDVSGLDNTQIVEPAAVSPVSIDPVSGAENCISANLVTPPPPGTPVPNAKVRLRAKDGSVWKETTTDANGWYEFDGNNEIEVLGYVDAEQPGNKHGRMVTETYPTITYLREWGWVNPDGSGLGRTIMNVDWDQTHTYDFNLNSRAIGWFAANYRANLQIEDVPVGTGDIRGFAYYDSLTPGVWTPDYEWDPYDERGVYGMTVELFDISHGPLAVPVATTKTGKNAKGENPMLKNQGYQGGNYPPDEFGGVFRWNTPGYYEFRGLQPGVYMTRYNPPAGYTPSHNPHEEIIYLPNNAGLCLPDDYICLVVVGDGAAVNVNYGVSTLAPSTIVENGPAPYGVPLSGEIEGGVFDDLHLQANPESILWDEKMVLSYAPISVYDHLGYFLGAGMMGNDLCHEFSHYADQNHDGAAGDTDPNVCPYGIESPEFEYRSAPGPHIYVGNDQAEWLTNWQFTTPDGNMTDENGNLILDGNGNPIQGPTYAAGSKSVRTVGSTPWMPEGIYYPEYEPLPWTYNFGQGKYKYEADWSLLPLSLSEAPLPNPLRGTGSVGGTLGNGAILPQNAPVITTAFVEHVINRTPYAFTGMQMFAMNETGEISKTDARSMYALLPAINLQTGPDSAMVVHVTGQNFGNDMGHSTVTLSGAKQHAWRWSDTQIDVLLNDSAVSGPLMVATTNGVSNAVPVNVMYDADRLADMRSRSVYVDATAGSGGNGTQESPYGAIGQALGALPDVSPVYVFVKPGVYKERVAITRSDVKLIGYGPHETTIDGIGSMVVDSLGFRNIGGPVVTIGRGGLDGGVSNVVVSGFTVRNGAVNYAANGGGGVFGEYGNNRIDINNNVIRNNGGEYGGGVWLHHSNKNVDIWSNVIALNGNTGGYGGGISVPDEPEYEVPGHAEPATGQHHSWDDELDIPDRGTYNIYNNRIVRNFSMDYGGGVSLYELKDNVNIYGNMFLENVTDDHGGAIFFEETGPADIYDNVFLWNFAPDDGGAISFEDVADAASEIKVHNNLFAENVADDRNENTAMGGAISFDDVRTAEIYGNTIMGNIVAGLLTPVGGAIASERHEEEYSHLSPAFSDAKIKNNIIWSNWRLKYDAPRASMEGLSFTFGTNYRWTPDNLFNDDPAKNQAWEQKVNANSFTVVQENLISGGYNGTGHDVENNSDADAFFPNPAGLGWRVPPQSAPRFQPDADDMANTLNSVRPGAKAPLSHPLLYSGGMTEDALRLHLGNDESGVFGLAIGGGATVNITVPNGHTITGAGSNPPSGGVTGVNFPFNTIVFNVTSATGGCVRAAFDFSTALPNKLEFYLGASNALLAHGNWTRFGSNGAALNVCDGGSRDADGAANGSVAWSVNVGDVVNVKPVADAGQDKNGYTGVQVALDGSNSNDPDGGPLSYVWAIDSAPAGSLATISSAGATATITPDIAGNYVISLVVNDGLFNSDKDTAVLTVIQSNHAPTVAPTAAPTSGLAPLAVSFAAHAADADPTTVFTYAWDFGDGSSSTEANPTHVYAAGSYNAKVTVSDGQASVTSGNIAVSVTAATGLKVKNAVTDNGGKNPKKGVVNIEAFVPKSLSPAPSDVYRVEIDGVVLVDTTFGKMKKGGVTYRYNDSSVSTTYTTTNGRIVVNKKNLDISGVSNSNGVDVVVTIGASVYAERINMTVPKGSKTKMTYKGK